MDTERQGKSQYPNQTKVSDMDSDHKLEAGAAGGQHLPAWAATTIALVCLREAGDEVTDEMVLSECEFADVDSTPVMILVQRKAPAAWPAFYDDPDGPRRVVGQLVIGLWFDLAGPNNVIIDTPQAQEALEILMEITGMPAPRMYPLAPVRSAIHSGEVLKRVARPATGSNRARGKTRKQPRRRSGSW